MRSEQTPGLSLLGSASAVAAAERALPQTGWPEPTDSACNYSPSLLPAFRFSKMVGSVSEQLTRRPNWKWIPLQVDTPQFLLKAVLQRMALARMEAPASSHMATLAISARRQAAGETESTDTEHLVTNLAEPEASLRLEVMVATLPPQFGASLPLAVILT